MDLSNINFLSKYGSNEVLNLEIKAYFDGNPAVICSHQTTIIP